MRFYQKVPAKHLWFPKAKLGQFIHFGLYSMLQRGEQVLYREALIPSEYRKLADDFHPDKYDPEAWANLAWETGHKYAVFTTKHIDGYCLFKTDTHKYNAVETGPGRDLVAEYVNAYRKRGFRVGLYFSVADWSQPGYFAGRNTDSSEFKDFVKMMHKQAEELCSNYGKIDILWFDTSWPYNAGEWEAKKLINRIRTLQPDIILNERLCLPGDITSSEQKIPDIHSAPKKMWESPMTTTNAWWGYHPGMDWKSSKQAIQELVKVVQTGGNLLYNVGPKPDGTLPEPYINLIKQTGAWLDKNGESIYETQKTLCETSTFGAMTWKKNKVYLHILFPSGNTIHFSGLKNKINRVYFLDGGQQLKYKQDNGRLYITLPDSLPDSRDSVIVLETEGTPASYNWASERLWTAWKGNKLIRAKKVVEKRQNWARS
jgi:alpha-L-fucosidase